MRGTSCPKYLNQINEKNERTRNGRKYKPKLDSVFCLFSTKLRREGEREHDREKQRKRRRERQRKRERDRENVREIKLRERERKREKANEEETKP